MPADKTGSASAVQASGPNSALNAGVAKREVWAWAMYDFANSGFTTVVLTTVFSVYFVGVVAAGKSWGTLAFTAALSLSYLLIMFTMPSLGARADARAGKRRLLFTSTVGCVVATALLGLTGPGDIFWGLLVIALANYCYCVGESIVAAFLPEIARPHALGRVSGWGWSFGYFGGMLALGLSLALVSWASGRGQTASQYVPYVMVLTAGLFALAAIPSFLFLRERTPPTHKPAEGVLGRLRAAWHDTSVNFPDFRILLICGACYQAGIAVVVTLAAVYATEAMGFTMEQTMLLVFTVNIAAAAGAFLFGYLQDRLGHKPALFMTLVGWIVMVLLAYSAIEVWVFWLAATVAGLCMGTSQSAGRAMVGALAPRKRLAEFYSLWTFAIQLAALVGPLFYGLVTWLTDGNHRLALLCTGVFFVAGLAVLTRLDFARGARARDTMSV
ncbi:MFS transporter [Pollutimonas harenae]|uniref:MFS transporter n=1 Tax=Pollutimonas harenae TaxID=657015 RepID=A0A853GR56_9BURK|nr:MFS transporter [Pollutimonas harenae]NYT85558.1 MFS transporter [Pollutimonas harenae]TEA70642.1 MFS transporter [Pollutimonas harenae]